MVAKRLAESFSRYTLSFLLGTLLLEIHRVPASGLLLHLEVVETEPEFTCRQDESNGCTH